MNNVEVAEILNSVDMFELASKTVNNAALNDTESVAVAELDRRFKEIGKAGYDKDHEIAAFVEKTVNQEIYNAPDELLDEIFERDSIGEFDDYEAAFLPPKNTLVAYEAVKGGNVDRSFLDVSVLKPTWKNYQVEFELSFRDVKTNGWKSVALFTDYAVAAFKNKMFAEVFNAIDNGILMGAENYIAETSAMPTQASMDKMALYLMDQEGDVRNIVGLSKYIQAASKLTSFVSDELINEVNRNGRLGVYDSCSMVPISSAKKLGSGDLLIPDHRLFGIAGKIGSLTMRGDITTYEHEDTNKEKFHFKLAGFNFGYAFNKDTLEKVCVMHLGG